MMSGIPQLEDMPVRLDDAARRTLAFEQELRKARDRAIDDRAVQESYMDQLLTSIDALNLEEAVRDATINDAKLFTMYETVAFKGLGARPDLNAKRATVIGFDAVRRRYMVSCERHVDLGNGNFGSSYDGEQVKCKSDNLVKSTRLPAFLGIAAGGIGKTDVRIVTSWLDTCGGDIEARHPVHNDTMLTLSVYAGDTALVAELLRRGADVEAAARNGTTALMYAAGTNSRAMITQLLAARADTLRLDAFGLTAADIARNKGHEDVESMLRTVVLHEGATAAADSVMLSPSALGDPSAKLDLAKGSNKLSTGFSIERQQQDAGDDPYLKMLVKANSHTDTSRKAKLLQDCIALDASRGAAYYNLGWLLTTNADVNGALGAFEQAAERWAEDGPDPNARNWGQAIGTSFNLRNSELRNFMGKHQARPSYGWDDASLLEMSGRVVAATPNEADCWEMRGAVLAGFIDQGQRPRSLEQYRQAAKCYEKAAALAASLGQQVDGQLQKAKQCKCLGKSSEIGKPLMADGYVTLG